MARPKKPIPKSPLLKVLQVDVKVQKIFDYTVTLLKDKGLYDESLEIQILNLSVQLFQFQQLINSFAKTKIDTSNNRRNQASVDLTMLSENIRKNLKELGLSLESKHQGVKDNDPLSMLMEKMNGEEDDDD